MKPIFVLLSLALTASSVNALTIDSDIYFTVAQAKSRVIALSRQPCQHKEAAERKWMRATYYLRQIDWYEELPGCWLEVRHESPYGGMSDMKICSLDGKMKLTGACDPANYGVFRKTKDLPSGKGF